MSSEVFSGDVLTLVGHWVIHKVIIPPLLNPERYDLTEGVIHFDELVKSQTTFIARVLRDAVSGRGGIDIMNIIQSFMKTASSEVHSVKKITYFVEIPSMHFMDFEY